MIFLIFLRDKIFFPRNFTAETKFRKCTFDRKTKFCTPIDLDENRKEGFIPGKLTPEACQNHCALW